MNKLATSATPESYSLFGAQRRLFGDKVQDVASRFAWGFWLKKEIAPVFMGPAERVSNRAHAFRENLRWLVQEFSDEGEGLSRRRLEGDSLRAVAATVAGQTVDLARAAREQLSDITDRALLNLVGEMPVGLPHPEETVVGIHPKLVEQLINGVGAEQ